MVQQLKTFPVLSEHRGRRARARARVPNRAPAWARGWGRRCPQRRPGALLLENKCRFRPTTHGLARLGWFLLLGSLPRRWQLDVMWVASWANIVVARLATPPQPVGEHISVGEARVARVRVFTLETH